MRPMRHVLSNLRVLTGVALLAISVLDPAASAAGLQKTVLVTGAENPMQVEVLADGVLLEGLPGCCL